ncbi:LamG-like jellyroll fold domain-containing protein [Streptomyces sp. NPDC005820]|uniref:LamG-like jellyroll fold domain-containing protein n=1 Tax=Streptomyces sp. NPDC005820 TaxID=3157069 RepID=UPI003402862C
MAKARRTGRPVDIPALGSESREVHAEPGGTYSARMYARPVRARKGSGWVPIDPRLAARPDGTVAPVAAAVDLRLSGGGTGPLVRLRRDGTEFRLSWPRQLPAPVLDGASATYPEVLPGVDLMVHATGTGFSEVLVVKSAAAARQAALARARFGLATTGLTVRTDRSGTTVAVDKHGKAMITFGAAWMWDSAGGPDPRGRWGRAAVPRTREPAAGDRRARMGLVVDRGALTIVPDRTMLLDRRVTFPLYLDPQWAADRQHWLMVEQDLPNYGWFDSSYDARVGRDPEDSTTDRFRSYFQMDTSFVADKLVKKAVISFAERWRYSCTPEPVHLWLTGALGPNATWADKPAPARLLGSFTTPTDSTNCDSYRNAEFDIKPLLTEAATNHWTQVTLALLSDESAGANGAKVFDNNPFIDVVYNTVPAAPVLVSTAGVPGCSDTSPTYINKTRAELRVRLVDADPDQQTRATVEWREVGATAVNSLDTGYGTSGSELPMTVTLVAGHSYEWRARAYNPITETDIDTGPYSAWCRVVVDTTKPTTVPTITRVCPGVCPEYEVDKPATFTFNAGADPDVATFSYTLAPGSAPAVRVPSVGGSATVQITPESANKNTLTVFALDRAGNAGSTRQLTFYPRALANPAAWWKIESGQQVMADSAGSHPATLTGGYSWTQGRDGSAALNLDGTDGTGAQTDGPVVNTNASFTVMAWLRLDDVGDWRNALSQAGARYNGFNLRLDMLTRKWAFAMRESDEDGAAEPMAVSNTHAQVGVWTHVAGVYDHEAGELRIYVNGRLAGRTAHRSTWNAQGPFGFGYSNYYGFHPSRWMGSIDDVRVYSFAASTRKVIETMGVVGKWGPKAWWQLDGNGVDSTYQEHTVTSIGGAGWTTRLSGQDALSLDGNDDSAFSEGPVVHTDRSFSVAAWVRLDRANGTVTAVSQDGEYDSGFTLGHLDGAGWAFTMNRSDSLGSAAVFDRAIYQAPVQLGVWTHLAGVYDANLRQLSLYVNGRLAATSPHQSTWDAQSVVAIGRAKNYYGYWGQWWPGGVDDVRLTEGAETADMIKSWMGGEYSYGPQGTWELDEQTGTTSRDSTGNGHNLYVSAPRPWTAGRRGGALQFGGNEGEAAYTAGPVVATNASFTVAAWVRLDRLDRNATVLSQDGGSDSGFTLGYDAAAGRWIFAMSKEDRSDGEGLMAAVRSTAGPVAGTWTHLAGTYDAKKYELKLYVNGALAGTVLHRSTWNATGPLQVGRGKLNGVRQDWWPGSVDQVQAVDYPMAPEQVRELVDGTLLGPGGWWPLDENSGAGAPDTSGNGYSLALAGGASWTAGRCGSALLLDGTSGRATSPGPVLRTDRSFTVAAWVRLGANNADAAVLSQDGLLASSFYLGYNRALNKWWFILPTADSSNPEDVVAVSTEATQLGVWTHLAGVYDAATHEMRLYVNGVPTAATTVATTWNAVGGLRLGGAQWNHNPVDYWLGTVDDVRALARAASQSEIQDLMAGCRPPANSRFENPDDVAIPDLSTVESRVTVSGRSGSAPTTLHVEVAILHTYRGDLAIDLIGPSGRAYRLKNFQSGDGTDNVVATYTVDASAEQANGVWRLRVQDTASGDSGRIDGWGLVFA